MASPITQVLGAGAASLVGTAQQVTPIQNNAAASAAASGKTKQNIQEKTKREVGSTKQIGENKKIQDPEIRVESTFTQSALKHAAKDTSFREKREDEGDDENQIRVDTIA